MSADTIPTGPRDELPGVDRLLALSGGVVAIAITLLVLQLNVPEPTKLTDPASASELATQLGKGADSLISYVISFYVIAQFWLVHHRVFRRITGQREGRGNTGCAVARGGKRIRHRLVNRHCLGERRCRQYCWLLLAVAPRVAERWAGRRPVA